MVKSCTTYVLSGLTRCGE